MTGTIPVAVVVMTRDEAANIDDCLESVAGFAQVLVVDSHSTDDTVVRAQAKGAVVVPFSWNGRYPKKKQWCLDTLPLAHDWVLFVDADERVAPALAAEIARLMARGPEHAGYFVRGQPVFLGRLLRHGAWNCKLALLHRHRARFPEVPDLDVATMWEVEGHYQPKLDGPAGWLHASLRHADAKPLFHWFQRHNRYSDWEAALAVGGHLERLAASDTPTRRRLKRLFQHLPARPLLVFLHGWLWRLGFLDGRAGFHHALARAFYYWQIEVKRRDFVASGGRGADTTVQVSRGS